MSADSTPIQQSCGGSSCCGVSRVSNELMEAPGSKPAEHRSQLFIVPGFAHIHDMSGSAEEEWREQEER